MPHLTLEYTGNVSGVIRPVELLPELHEVLAREAWLDIRNCKSRAICREDYYIGQGTGRQAFVHLEIRLLEGRSSEVKHDIGESILAVLWDHLSTTPADLNLQLTVEIVDMQRAVYFKAERGGDGAA
jgi:5-carboxymethyl-2-hydroxymuconate isomerase